MTNANIHNWKFFMFCLFILFFLLVPRIYLFSRNVTSIGCMKRENETFVFEQRIIARRFRTRQLTKHKSPPFGPQFSKVHFFYKSLMNRTIGTFYFFFKYKRGQPLLFRILILNSLAYAIFFRIESPPFQTKA